MICLRHTGGQASRSRLPPCYSLTAPDKHAARRRDQRGEARRPSSSTSPACAQQRHHRLSTAKSGARFSCPDLLGTLWRPAAGDRAWYEYGAAAAMTGYTYDARVSLARRYTERQLKGLRTRRVGCRRVIITSGSWS